MAEIADMTKGVQWQLETMDMTPSELVLNEELGFIQVKPAVAAVPGIRLVGFGAPRASGGGFDEREVPETLVDFADLGPEARSIHLQGKGVGPRMYNSPAAAAWLWDAPGRVGAYLFDILPEKLLDRRTSSGPNPARMVRGGIPLEQVPDEEIKAAVTNVHASYGDADGVLFDQPTGPGLGQLIEGRHEPAPLSDEFIIIRNAAVGLRKVGEYLGRQSST